MRNIIFEIKQNISEKTSNLLDAEFGIKELDQSVFKYEIPPEESMGNLAFACFPLAKFARKSPLEIATKLAEKWPANSYFSKIEAKGPYLNFFFSPEHLANNLVNYTIENKDYGNNNIGHDKTVMLEFSSPNTNKPLHLGHGRNNLLGITLSRIFECGSYHVVKANLVNDRGVHICKSMLAYQKWGQKQTPESTGKKGDKLVGEYYVMFDKKAQDNPKLLEEAQEMLQKWEKGDPDISELGKQMNGWVMAGFKETYQRMGINFNRIYFESETFKGGKKLVQLGLKLGICHEEPNGAIAIDLEKEKLGKKILLRGDGTSMYITQDINTTVQKFKDFDLDGCLFVVGSEQDNHFRILFTVLEKFNFDWANLCEHISYGMITLPEGRMKSREGKVVDLDDLIDEMKFLALEEVKNRQFDEKDLVTADFEKTAEAIGQAAINFFILRTNAVREIQFNPKESLSFDGATGPYLQYTHARICSLLRKNDSETTFSDKNIENYSWQASEINLLVMLARFPDALQSSLTERNPAVICSYVYDLCRLFNKFYYDLPILKSETEDLKITRLAISKAVKAVLQKNLEILGIVALERM